MKRYFYALCALLLTLSCGKNGWYINIDGTYWSITSDTQEAIPCFVDDTHASIIQINLVNKYYQTQHGTFSLDGHRVEIDADNTEIRFTRTFSHLKNSKNKNFSSMYAGAPSQPVGSVWATQKDADLLFTYLGPDGKYLSGTYANMTRKEGIDYGWSFTGGTYAVNGSHITTDKATGTFFGGKVLSWDTYSVPLVSVSALPEGSSSLEGTVWTLQSADYPGFILFTSATEFTRVLSLSNIVFGVLSGTYTLKGNSLEFTTDSQELNRVVTLEGDRFTYLEKTYSLVPSASL